MKTHIEIEVDVRERIGNHLIGTWEGKIRTDNGVSQLRDTMVLRESIANVLIDSRVVSKPDYLREIRLFGSDNQTLLLGDGHDDDNGWEGRWLTEIK